MPETPRNGKSSKSEGRKLCGEWQNYVVKRTQTHTHTRTIRRETEKGRELERERQGKRKLI